MNGLLFCRFNLVLVLVLLVRSSSVQSQASPDLPINTPFITEGNRPYDGISSVSPYSFTSPAFPIYSGPVSPTYQQSIVPLITSSSHHSFNVRASEPWNPSGFQLEPLQEYALTSSSTNSTTSSGWWYDRDIQSSAMGYRVVYHADRNCDVVELTQACHAHHAQRRFRHQNWMTLICCVGKFQWLVHDMTSEVSQLRRTMPLQEQSLDPRSCVAVSEASPATTTTRVRTSTRGGELLCFANDAFGQYWDNTGSMTVTIEQLTS